MKTKAAVTAVKKCEGEAQLVNSRGKARAMFEYKVDLEFEVSVENNDFGAGDGMDGMGGMGGSLGLEGGAAVAGPAAPPKAGGVKYVGTLKYAEVNPTVGTPDAYECRHTWKKGKAPTKEHDGAVKSAVKELKAQLVTKYEAFIVDFTSKK